MAHTELCISTPQIMNWFSRWKRSSYSVSIKPYNRFVHVALEGMQASPVEKITLVAPVGTVKDAWFANIHDPDGKAYRIIARRSSYPDQDTRFGKTFDDLISQHRYSKESKFVTSTGEKLTTKTRGLLSRQSIYLAKVLHVGKETNEFELVEAGLVDREDDVLMIYQRDPWEELQPIVAKMTVEEIIRITGYSRRMAYSVKAGKRRPSEEAMSLFKTAVSLSQKNP